MHAADAREGGARLGDVTKTFTITSSTCMCLAACTQHWGRCAPAPAGSRPELRLRLRQCQYLPQMGSREVPPPQRPPPPCPAGPCCARPMGRWPPAPAQHQHHLQRAQGPCCSTGQPAAAHLWPWAGPWAWGREGARLHHHLQQRRHQQRGWTRRRRRRCRSRCIAAAPLPPQRCAAVG